MALEPRFFFFVCVCFEIELLCCCPGCVVVQAGPEPIVTLLPQAEKC